MELLHKMKYKIEFYFYKSIEMLWNTVASEDIILFVTIHCRFNWFEGS